jgi:hypothetical protein
VGSNAGRPGTAFDDEGDGLVGEACLADRVAAMEAAEHSAPVDAGGVEPLAERPHSASLRGLRVRHRDLRALLFLIGLGLADRDQKPARRVKVQIVDVERDELRAYFHTGPETLFEEFGFKRERRIAK